MKWIHTAAGRALVVVGITLSLQVPAAEAKCDYKFSGRLIVEHNGKRLPLRGAQVRVKREEGTGAGRGTVRTDAEGRFSGKWRFDRDRDGRLPGRKDIRFAVQFQLDNGAFRVQKGGTAPKPWDTFKRVQGKDCRSFDVGTFTLDTDLTSGNYAAQRAYIYTVYDWLLERLRGKGVAFKSKLRAIYPSKHLYDLFKDSSWFVHKAHIEQDDWDNERTLIHESMHQWDVEHMGGEKHVVCLADAHHKEPGRWGSSRCSGFMEGFAEAMAQRFRFPTFSDEKPFLADHQTLRQGGKGIKFPIRSRQEAERNDDGWQNFLEFMMTRDEWEVFSEPVPDPSCNPRDVSIYQILQVLKAEAPRKADWNRLRTNATFSWFTEMFVRRGLLSANDARFYELLGDPSLSPTEIQQAVCGPGQRGEVRRPADAALVHPNGKAYFFVDQKYYRFDFRTDSVDKVGRIGIDGWKGVPQKVDAVLMHPNGKAYFFAGDSYHRYDFAQDKVDKVGKTGVDGWSGLNGRINAALLHPNGKAYFFRGSRYYRYDFSKRRVDKNGKVGADGWSGLISEPLGAALLHPNGKAYFFRGRRYFRYDFEARRVDKSATVGIDGWPGL